MTVSLYGTGHAELACLFPVSYGKWANHVQGFWDARTVHSILFVTYEDISKVCYDYICTIHIDSISAFDFALKVL